MKQKLLSLFTLYSILFSLLLVVPQTVKAQNIVFTVTCVNNSTSDTASLNAQIAAISTATGKIVVPYKSNSAQRCKFNTATIPSNVTLDGSIGSGIEVVAGQTLTVAGPIFNPSRKQLFFGTGTVVATGGGIISAHWFAGADLGIQIGAASTAATGVPTEIQAFGGGTFGTIFVVQEHHTLHLFPGTYTLNTSGGVAGGGLDTGVIQLKDNTQLVGEGDNTIIVENSTPNCSGSTCRYRMIVSWATTQSPGNQLQSRNVQVRNLQLQGSAVNPHDGGIAAAINFGNCDGSKATNVFFNRVSGYAVQFGANPESGFYAKNGVFSDNRMLNLQSQNMALITGENVEISRNKSIDPGVPTIAVTNATNATPVVVTTATPNNITTGAKVWIAGVLGNTAANSNVGAGLAWRATRISSTQFSLTGTIDANGTVVLGNVAGSGTYTSGTGFVSNQGPALVAFDIEPNGYTHGEEKVRGVHLQDNVCDFRNTTTTVGCIAYNPTSVGIPNQGGIITGNTVLGRSVGVVVTGATNASPIVVTADQNEFSNGDTVIISGVNGNTAANGTWAVTRIDGQTFSLNNSVGNGAFSSSASSLAVKWAGGQSQLSIGIAVSRYSTGVIVADNFIARASQSAISASGDKISVHSNEIEDSGTGGLPTILLSWLTNSKVSDSKATWRDDHAVVMGESDTNTNNTITNNRIDLIEHLTGSTVTNSTYQGNQAVTGPTGIYGGIKESTNSNNNTYIENTTQPASGTLYGLSLVGSTSTYVKHNFTNKAGNAYGIQPKFCFTGLNCEYTGTGSPEGVMTGTVGSTYRNTSNGDFFRKTSGSGNTGWTASTGGGTVTSVTGTAPIASTGGATPVISLNDTAVTPGVYTNANITVDAKGRLTSAASGSATGACGSTTQVQFNLAGSCGADSNFVWDNTNKWLGIGNTPTSPITLTSNVSGTDGGMTIVNANVTPAPSLLFRGARGSIGSPTAVLDNDAIGRVVAQGYGTTGYGVSSSPAGFFMAAGGNFSDTSHPTYMTWANTPVSSTTRAENMRLSTAGLDVAAHSAFGATATIDQIIGGSGVGPTLINTREAITAFDPSWTKMHGTYTYYSIDPSGAMPSNMEIYGGQSVIQVPNGNTQALAGLFVGHNGTVLMGANTSFNSAIGLWGDVQYSGAGVSGQTMRGVLGYARTVSLGTTGTITAAIGGEFAVHNNIASTITSARGVTGNITQTSNGTITNASTIQATTPVNSGGGTIGTLIQLDLRDPTGTASTVYGVWGRGSTVFNKLEGNFLLGDGTAAAGKLDVQGSLNFTAFTAPGAATAGTPTAGGSCTAGTHSYKVAFTSVGPGEVTGSTSNVITCVLTTGQTVGLSGIPLGPIGTTSRKIYRTVAGDAGSYLLAGTIANNTTTTFSDTVADGSLGAAAPGSNTTAVANFSTGGTNWMTVASNGRTGIGTTTPGTRLHVWGGYLYVDPSGVFTATGIDEATVPTSVVVWSNPSIAHNAISLQVRQNFVGEATPSGAGSSALHTSIDNLNGRTEIWGGSLNAQQVAGGSGGNVRGLEVNVQGLQSIGTDPFGATSRVNGIEIMGIDYGVTTSYMASYLGTWHPETDGNGWAYHGLYVSRAKQYGLTLQKRSDDAVSPFAGAMIFADSPSPYVILGGVRTFTNGIDFSASTISTSAFKSSGFNVNGSGALSAASGTFASLTSGRVPINSTSGLLIDDADLTFTTDTLFATKFSGPTIGVTTNSDAAAGQVGEFVSGTLAFGSRTSLTTATAKTITSISLTAGDWDISGNVVFFPANTTNVTALAVYITSTDNGTSSAPDRQVVRDSPSGGLAFGAPTFGTSLTPMRTRISLAATTTFYITARADFSVSTMEAWGIITARRVR